MTRKVDIVSLAFIQIGEPPVNDLETGGQYIASASKLYDLKYPATLTSRAWGFAKNIQQLTRLADTPLTVTGWSYAYQLPADCLLPRRIYPRSDYEIMSDKIFSNEKELWLQYSYKPIEAKLPAYFIDYLVTELCANFCVLVTGKQSLQKMYQDMVHEKFSVAAFRDSVAYPQQEIQDKPFVDVRF